MSRSITGIDIGSAYIKVAVCSEAADGNGITVRALAKVESDGLKNGNVLNPEAVSEALAEALREAEKVTGERIRKAHIAIGGTGLGTITDISTVAISRADSTASEFDVARALEESETRLKERANLRLVHTVPSEYKIDGRRVIGKPHGYVGNKLELRTIYVTCLAPSLESLVSAVENTGVEVENVYAGPVAESIATLSATSRNAGCALVNIGAETVAILTHEDGLPTSLKVFPIGSAHITHDIALGLKISPAEAEKLKHEFGSVEASGLALDSMIGPRVEEIFSFIHKEVIHSGYQGRLPAGVVLTGGAALLDGVSQLAGAIFGLPSRRGIPQNIGGHRDLVTAPQFSTGIGLVKYMVKNNSKTQFPILEKNIYDKVRGSMRAWIKDLF